MPLINPSYVKYSVNLIIFLFCKSDDFYYLNIFQILVSVFVQSSKRNYQIPQAESGKLFRKKCNILWLHKCDTLFIKTCTCGESSFDFN